MIPRSDVLAMIAVFLLALAARFTFLAAGGVREGGDTPEYAMLAHNLVVHRAYTLSSTPPFIPMVRRSPSYPAFIAVLTGRGAVDGRRIAAVQIALDSCVAAALLLLTPAVPMRSMRIAAAAMYALHPAAIASASTLLSEALFTFLLACGVVLVIAGRRSDRLLLSGAGGVVMALAILCRPIAMLYVLSSVVVLLLWRRQPRAASHVVALLAGCALTVLPWTVRCTAVTGRLVIAQAAGITNWYLPTRWDLDQSDQVTLWREFNNDPYGRRLNAARTPAEIAATSRFGAEQALRNVRANPSAYIAARIRTYPHLFISSFGATVGVNRTLGAVVGEHHFGTALLLAGFLLVFSILPLAAAAAGVRGAVRDPAGALCVALVVSTLLVHIPMWIEYRYWLPVLPYELALAAAGAAVIAGWQRRPAPSASVD